MNAGVGTSPCAVRRTPARASPSVAVTVNVSTRASVAVCPHLQDEHRVAERVEAIALIDCEPIQAPRLLDAHEGHDEREQRRAWQVEVRQQGVDATELEA